MNYLNPHSQRVCVVEAHNQTLFAVDLSEIVCIGVETRVLDYSTMSAAEKQHFEQTQDLLKAVITLRSGIQHVVEIPLEEYTRLVHEYVGYKNVFCGP